MRIAPLALAFAGCATRLLTPEDFAVGASDLAVASADLGASEAASPDLAPGPFRDVHTPVPGCDVAAIAHGDLDGDGHDDLALACSNGVAILLGNGDGSFRKRDLGSIVPAGAFTRIVTGDLDGDGHPDVVASAASTQLTLPIVGIGGTPSAERIGHDGAPSGLDVGDLNGDGKLDIAAAVVRLTPAALEWVPGKGDGTVGTMVLVSLSEQTTGRCVLRDLDGDGKLDVAIGTDGQHVALLKGDGAGNFAALDNVFVPDASMLADVFAAADLDGDGLDDLLVAGTGSVYAVANHAGFVAHRLFTPTQPIAGAAIGDLDGNGLPDVAICDGEGAFFYSQGGDLAFGPGQNIGTIGGASAIAIADENGDQLDDVIVGSNGAIDVFLRRP